MPKVVIELQANTQDAVNKIQQFARAQKDAFDAVKAGSPALQDAFVKVSKLTESTKGATQSTVAFNQAAKNLAKGGIAELIAGVPVVGSSLTSLAGTLKGFPLILGGVVAAGIGVLKFLDDLSAKATVALDRVTALGAGLARAQTLSNLEIQGIRAGAAGNEAGALNLAAQAARERARQATEDAVAAAAKQAESERASALSIEGIVGVISSGGKIAFDEKQAAEVAKKIADARIAAKGKEALEILAIDERLKADLGKLEARYDEQLAGFAEKRVAAEAEAAEAAAKAAARIAEIDAERQAALTGTTEKVQELTAAMTESGEAAVGAGELWLRSIEGISQALDEIIAKTRAAGGGGGVTAGAAVTGGGGATAGGGASGGGGTGPTGVYGLDFSVLGGITGQTAAAAPITNVTVNQTGTVIQQDRDWQTLVEQLKASLGS